MRDTRAGKAHTEFGFPHEQSDLGGGIRTGEDVQAGGRVVGFAVADAARIEHHAAADGHDGREHADDEPIAGQQERRFAQHDAGVCDARPVSTRAAPPRRRISASISAVPEWKCTGARCLSGLAERSRSSEQSSCRRDTEPAGRGQHHAARDLRGFDIGEIQGRALAGGGAVCEFSMHLHAAHPQLAAGRVELPLPLLG